MEAGKCIVLLNLNNLYESLYDALNQYYVYLGDQKFVDLGLGTQRVKCRVHKDFRLIVVAEKGDVYREFPIPLINRLEKHFLSTRTMLSKQQIKLAKRLDEWAHNFATIREGSSSLNKATKAPKVGDVFIGYHPDAAASIVLQVWKMFGEALCDNNSNPELIEEIFTEAQDVLLRCATPESVVRLKKSHLGSVASELYWRYIEQEHESLMDLLGWEIKERSSDNEPAFLQVFEECFFYVLNFNVIKYLF